MTYNRQNHLMSKSVQISNLGSTGSSACDSNSNTIDFTGSPVMCETGSVSYISGVVWEDRGTLDNNTFSYEHFELWIKVVNQTLEKF